MVYLSEQEKRGEERSGKCSSKCNGGGETRLPNSRLLAAQCCCVTVGVTHCQQVDWATGGWSWEKGNEVVVLLGLRGSRLGQQAPAAHPQREREKKGKKEKREGVPWVFECEERGTSLRTLTHPFNFFYLLIYLFIFLLRFIFLRGSTKKFTFVCSHILIK